MRYVACFIFALASLFAYSQRTSHGAELLFADPKQESSTATRTSRKINESFTTVRIISRQEIRLSGALTAQEAIERTIPDIEGIEGAVSRYVSSRGANAAVEFNERTLMLLDGCPLNSASIGHVMLAGIPVHHIDRIEVAFGPGSAVYGPNAFSGVINIVTRTPEQIEREASGGFASRDGATAHLSALMPFANGSLMAGGSFFRDPGSDRVLNNDTKSNDFHFVVRSKQGSSNWTGRYQYFNIDRGSIGTGAVFATPNDRMSQVIHAVQLGHEAPMGGWTASTRFQGLVSDLDLLRELPPGSSVTFLSRTRSFIGVLEQLFQRNTQNAHITAGIEGRMMRASGGVLPDRTNTNVAAFIQSEYRWGSLQPVLGVRFDSHSIYGAELSPRAGLVFNAGQGTFFRSSYGRSFRAPNASELYNQGFPIYTMHPQFGLVQLNVFGNIDLRPEIMDAFEIGFNHQSKDGWHIDVAAFQNEMRDLIDLTVRFDPNNPDPTNFTYSNLGRVRVQGAAATVSRYIGSGVDVSLGWSRAIAKDIGNNSGYGSSSPDRAIARIAYRGAGPIHGQLTAIFPSVAVGSGTTSGVVAHLNLVCKVDRQHELNFRIDNLFNTANMIGPGVSGGSRSLMLRLVSHW